MRSDAAAGAVLGRAEPRAMRSTATDAAICLATVAAGAHAVSTPDHWTWWRASGVLFAVLAVLQGALVPALYYGWRRTQVAVAGIVTNAAVAVLYVVSRTAGVPGAPPIYAHGGHKAPGRAIVPGAVEGIGPFDLFTLMVELLLVVALLALLDGRTRRTATNALAITGATLWALALVGVLG